MRLQNIIQEGCAEQARFVVDAEEFVVYGTGQGADVVSCYLLERGVRISGYVDSYIDGGEKNGRPIRNVSRLQPGEKIVIASAASAEIASLLEQRGYRFLSDYIALPTVKEDFGRQEFVRQNFVRFEQLQRDLCDVSSQENLSAYLLHLLTSGVLPKGYNCRVTDVRAEIAAYTDLVSEDCLTPLFQDREYLYSDTVVPTPGEVVLDVGGFCGDTALLFQHYTFGQSPIYVFEPVPSSFDRICCIAERFSNIHPIPYGLWSKNCRQLMEVDADRLDIARVADTVGNEEVALVRMDDFLDKEQLGRIDFIKVDVEGGELEVLRGAIKTLRENKPKLALAAYHAYDDLFQIWEFLQSIGYREFFFKHYGRAMNDFVLFAR